MTLRKIVASILLLTAVPAYAAGWTGELVVLSLNTESTNDVIYFQVSPAAVYTTGCDASHWMINPTTEGRQQRAYSTLLTAMMAGKKIRLWYTDSCSSWSYHSATAVKIIN